MCLTGHAVAIGSVFNWTCRDYRLCLTGHAEVIGYVLNWTCSVLVEEHQINFFVEEHRINLLLKEHQINFSVEERIRSTFCGSASDQLSHCRSNTRWNQTAQAGS